MNLHKILLSIFCFSLFYISFVESSASFRPECYEYYAKIWSWITIDDQVYKITSNKNLSKVVQDGKLLSFKDFKESIPVRSGEITDFSFLNDNNKRTFNKYLDIENIRL